MNNLDRQYLELTKKILETGRVSGDRTGTGTIRIFDGRIEHDMSEGFPLLTTKRVWFKGVLHELLWFLRGDTNIKYLVDNDVHIWDEWPWKNYVNKTGDEIDVKTFANKILNDDEFANKWGDVGKVYGAQWTRWTDTTNRAIGIHEGDTRQYRELNQIDDLINKLKTNPTDRRMLVTAWNPAEVRTALLPPCHYGFQCFSEELTFEERADHRMQWLINNGNPIAVPLIRNNRSDEELMEEMDLLGVPKRRLSLKWQIRSIDWGLGFSFDMASYGLLLTMLSHVTNHIPHRLIMASGDTHIYLNHIDIIKEQFTRESYDLPILEINKAVKSIYDFKYEDFEIVNYKHSGDLKMPISI